MASLRASSPESLENYFTIIRAGRYWGVSCVCPACGWRPGIGEKHRWRSLAIHEAAECKQKRKTIDMAMQKKQKRLER
jgi:hypothetical protein